MRISDATLKRLTQIYRTLSRIIWYEDSESRISSAGLGDLIGVPSHTIRKDISCLGEIGASGKGYVVSELHQFIGENLGLDRPRRAAVVGLGRIGTAILEYGRFEKSGFTVVAGFDSNVNRVDTLVTEVPLFPSYDIPEIASQKGVELAFLAVPASGAERCLERLIEAGVKGVLNFSPLILKSSDIIIRNVDITGELTLLSAMIQLQDNNLV